MPLLPLDRPPLLPLGVRLRSARSIRSVLDPVSHTSLHLPLFPLLRILLRPSTSALLKRAQKAKKGSAKKGVRQTGSKTDWADRAGP